MKEEPGTDVSITHPVEAPIIYDDSDDSFSEDSKEVRWGRANDKLLFDILRDFEEKYGQPLNIVSALPSTGFTNSL